MVTFLPSSSSQQITVVENIVATTLTISAVPSVIQGQPLVIDGILSRNDTFQGLNGETIVITIDGAPLATVLTSNIGGTDGRYSITVNMDVAGTFTLAANFAGATRAGLTLLPSQGIFPVGAAISPGALLLGAGLLILLTQRK